MVQTGTASPYLLALFRCSWGLGNQLALSVFRCFYCMLHIKFIQVCEIQQFRRASFCSLFEEFYADFHFWNNFIQGTVNWFISTPAWFFSPCEQNIPLNGLWLGYSCLINVMWSNAQRILFSSQKYYNEFGNNEAER